MTTLAKSSVSEVTRLTILPDGYLSKNDMSRFDHRVEGVLAEAQHDVADDPGGKPLADELNSHDEDAGDEDTEQTSSPRSPPLSSSVNWSMPQAMSTGVQHASGESTHDHDGDNAIMPLRPAGSSAQPGSRSSRSPYLRS